MAITQYYKLLFVIGCLSFGAFSCNSSDSNTGNKGAKKAVLIQKLNNKKADLEKAKADIRDIEKQLAEIDPEYQAKEEAKKWRLVSTEAISVKDFEKTLDFQGTVATKGNFVVSSEMGGIISLLNVKEGDQVRKGQLIGKVDDAILQRNMDELDASIGLAKNAVVAQQNIVQQDKAAKQKNIEELELQLSLSRDVFNRRKKLWDQNIGSELDFIQAKNNVESLEIKLSSLKKQVSMAGIGSNLEYQQAQTNVSTLTQKKAALQLQLDKTSFYAPASGAIEQINVKQGEMTGPGTPILTVVNANQLQIASDVPENYLKSIKKGNNVIVSVPVIGFEQKGKISHIGATINPQNRTFKVEVDVPNKNGLLKPNLMANIQVIENKVSNAVVVPTKLILNDTKGSYVFVAEKQGDKMVAKRKDITLGDASDTETLVSEGLNGKETLISEGHRMVTDGDIVKVTN